MAANKFLYMNPWSLHYNGYDEEGTVASLAGKGCVFCDKVVQKDELLYEDDKCVIFRDKKPHGKIHL